MVAGEVLPVVLQTPMLRMDLKLQGGRELTAWFGTNCASDVRGRNILVRAKGHSTWLSKRWGQCGPPSIAHHDLDVHSQFLRQRQRLFIPGRSAQRKAAHWLGSPRSRYRRTRTDPGGAYSCLPHTRRVQAQTVGAPMPEVDTGPREQAARRELSMLSYTWYTSAD